MAESSACLVRSFTTPAETSYESNPVRALGESISFGRFMTENLNWEKWSTFTHNRYVEEAEKYSKPGSVAAKKAYFEAHYKRKAAERAAALIREANAQANGSFESEVKEGNCTESSFETSSKEDIVVVANEQPDEETVNCQVAECADRDQYKCDAGQSDADISNVDGTEGVPHSHIDVGSCTLVDSSYPNQFHHVEDTKNVAVPEEESVLDHVNGTDGQEVSASLVEEREVNSSPKLSTKAVAAKHSPSCDGRKVVPPRCGINSLKGKKSVGDLVEKKRLTVQSLQMSIDLPSGAGITSKTATADTKPKIRINPGAKIVKSVGDSVKRPTTRSLHMSINLPSGAGETSKSAPVLEQNRIKKIHPSLPKNSTSALRTSVKASHGLLNEASANALSGKPLNKSVLGGVTENAKPSSISSSLKLSSTTKSNPQSATVSLPFRFRSEERAVKRKEFLQRINETKSKEEENVKLQRTLKGKTDHDHKKLRQSSGSLSKQNEDKLGGSQFPSNQIRKISPTLPQSSNLGWKANSSTVQDKSSRNSWKPPISTNNSKRTTEKINRTTRQSVTSLSNTTRENASPNIQL